MNAPPFAPGRPMRLETSAGPLEDGDCLSSKEFLKRREALPSPVKLELIEGIVQVDALRNAPQSAGPQQLFAAWLESYAAVTPGTQFENSSSVLLDRENVLQPDAVLRILPEYKGRTQTSEKGYVIGAPEFVAEVIFSRGIKDLRAKLAAYRRNGIQEFLAWRFHEAIIEWFQMEKGEYTLNLPGPNNILSSRVFPGLIVNATAVLSLDLKALKNTLKSGLDTSAHSAFVERLAKRKPAD